MKKNHHYPHHHHSCLFFNLSLDLFIHILDYLPDSIDRKTFRLVCRHFLRAESLHRKSLTVLRREFLPHLLRRYSSSIRALHLTLLPSFTDQTLISSLHGRIFPNLRSLDLSRANGVGWRGLEAMVASCPVLEAVDLSHCVGVGDREAAAVAKARGLRELRLDKCLEVTDVGLARVAVECGERLERLGVKWCMEISDIGVELLVNKCRGIRELDVSYLKITNKSLQSIASLEKLEVLSMVGCSNIDDDGLRYLNHGRNYLQSIDVSRCGNVTSSGLISVIEGQKSIQKLKAGDCFPDLSPLFFSKLSLLKTTLNTLKLDGSQVSASTLKVIGLNCKNLTDISLSKCKGVDDEGISELVKNCSDLRTIDLTCCHLVMDKAMSAIASHCKKLECLQLESCTLLTEKGMDYIGALCSNLKELDLTDCNMNDAALKFLSRCSKLMVLKLGLCSGISNEGLGHISSNCSNLLELDLYRCSRINDDGLASLAIGCKKLKKLNICYCNEMTDKGLKHLSSLKELQDLEMRSLYKVTSLGITAIAMGCVSLTELDVKKCYSVDDSAMSALAQYSPNLRQINISYCPITFIGLWKLLGNMRCLQDAKLVHLSRISVEGFELALRASCGRLKKLKLVTAMRNLLSPGLLQMLQARGCRLRCVDKPVTFGFY